MKATGIVRRVNGFASTISDASSYPKNYAHPRWRQAVDNIETDGHVRERDDETEGEIGGKRYIKTGIELDKEKHCRIRIRFNSDIGGEYDIVNCNRNKYAFLIS